MNRYHNSPYRALSTIFPQNDWKPWLFSQVSKYFDDLLTFIFIFFRGFWDKDENVRDALKWVETKLDIHKWEDWYTVNSKHLHNLGLSTLITKCDGNIFQLLKKYYPGLDLFLSLKRLEHPWDINFEVSDPVTKKLFESAITETFPNETILFNYFHPDPQLSKYSFSAFIPKLNLALDQIPESKSIDNEKKKKVNDQGPIYFEVIDWDRHNFNKYSSLVEFIISKSQIYNS